MPAPLIHVAIPAIDELQRLPTCLEDLDAQTLDNVRVWVCVNQPESWRDDPERHPVFLRNQATLDWLRERDDSRITIIDRSSPGRGWPQGRGGVGWARKVLFDHILEEAGDPDVLVSLDADTCLEPGYLDALFQRFSLAPKAVGLAAPYYHPLTGGEEDRDILRYELYLRHYLLCQLRTRSPWAFTALGSAMAVPVAVCSQVGGMTPKASGEDFYFLQKLRKAGPLLLWSDSPAKPAARYSDRVVFGTGPAMIAGRRGEWHRYPIYAAESFRAAAAAVDLFPLLHRESVETPLSRYAVDLFGDPDPWTALRANHPREVSFVRACHERFDGLRLLRFLRLCQQDRRESDEERLLDGVRWYAPEAERDIVDVVAGGGFAAAPVEALDRLRDKLAAREGEERKHHDGVLIAGG